MKTSRGEDPKVVIPPLREEIAIKRYSDRYFVEDRTRRLRLPIDALTLEIMEVLAEGPALPEPLTLALEAPAAELQRRVALLNAHLLLDTRRAAEQHALCQAATATPLLPREALASAPLRYPDELQHGCVACGACCHGTDVGPLKPDDIAKIEEIDWSPHLPAEISPQDWMVEVDYGPERITLMGMSEGRCVFLGADKLCVIHKVAGADQKPTICRQFPYTFTRTSDGIDVSFSMECRSWLRAKRQGRPVAEDEVTIRRLIAEGGPVLDLPAVVALWTGIDLDRRRWLGLRDELLEGVRSAESVRALVEALTAPLRHHFAEVHARCHDEERFAHPDAWSLPQGAQSPSDPARRFADTCARVNERLVKGIDVLIAEFNAAARPEEGDRARRVSWILSALFGGRRTQDLVGFSHALEIWRDLALASLYSHEPARRGELMLGVAKLVLRILAGELGARLLAQAALRGRVAEQDVVDSMVLLTKTLRGSEFERLLGGLRSELVELLIYNAGAFAGGQAPRTPHPRLVV